MPRNLTIYDLLISCPTDVTEELEVIKSVVQQFNDIFGKGNNVSLNIKHWSKDAYPESNGRAQDLLNNQFVSDCDMAIAVFWTKFGTPTGDYQSGTEEEIEELLKNNKQVFMYFSDRPVNPSVMNSDQFQKVVEFRRKYQDRGMYWTYDSIDYFKQSLLNHLSAHFLDKILDNETANQNEHFRSKLEVKGVNGTDPSLKLFATKIDFNDYELTHRLANLINDQFRIIHRIRDMNSINLDSITSEYESLRAIADYTKQFQMASSLDYSLAKLSDEDIEIIRNYAKNNNITSFSEDFFELGNVKIKNNIFRTIHNLPEKTEYVGQDDDVKAYESLLLLAESIKMLNGLDEFLPLLNEKYIMNLCISNSGTSYDDDIEVKIYIGKGKYVEGRQLSEPSEHIGDEAIRIIEGLLKPKRTSEIYSYQFYKSYRNDSFTSCMNSLYCYEVFEEKDYTILEFNMDYIKQKTSMFAPSAVIINGPIDEIRYRISSKQQPEVLEGIVEVECT